MSTEAFLVWSTVRVSVFLQRIFVSKRCSFIPEETALGYWVGMLTVLSSHNPTNSWPETSFMTSLECDFFQVFTEIKLLCQIHWCQKSIDQNVMQPEGSLKFCIVIWIISQRKKKASQPFVLMLLDFARVLIIHLQLVMGWLSYNWQKLIVECLPMSIIMYACFMKI